MTDRFTARFVPQAWVRDNAMDVDPEGETEWNVTEAFAALDPEYRAELLAEMASGEHDFMDGEALDHHDLLKADTNAPEWIREWHGPFSLYVQRAEPEEDAPAAPIVPTVVVIRDPDASNDATVFDGPVNVIDVDLGYADLSDYEEFAGWRQSHLETATAFPEGHGARTLIEEVVAGIAARYDHPGVPPRPDRYGGDWSHLDDAELCSECGQPDDRGECDHAKLDDELAEEFRPRR